MNHIAIADSQESFRRNLAMLTAQEKQLAAFLEMATWHEASLRPSRVFISGCAAASAVCWCESMAARLDKLRAHLRVIERQARNQSNDMQARRASLEEGRA